jgi:membrane fusion protein (multidrug efflux system)
MKSSQILTFTVLALISSGCGRKAAPPMDPRMMMPPPEVATVTVARQPVVMTTELPGRTTPFLIAEIRPQVNGLIQKRLFTEGEDVKAGAALYQIDPAPFQAMLDKATANLTAARSRAKRVGELLAAKAVSPQDFDDADAALKLAEADVELARINLGYTKITAPIGGRIGKSSVTDGAIVTAYQPVSLTTIQQLDPIYVDVPQSTADLLRLRQRLESGQVNSAGTNLNQVQIVLENGATYSLEGALQFRDVSVDPMTGTVILRMVFPNPDGVLLPGMFVRAVVKEGINDSAILIPQNAVSRDAKGTPMAMVVNAKSEAEIRILKTDRAVGNQWLVTDGLAPGDQVIVEGLQKVRPGAPVTVATPANVNRP